MENFKQSDEYAAIMTTQYEMTYNIGVEEIFNIWRKRRDVDYRFLGGELRNLMARWIDEENDGILDTRPSPSPKYSEAKEDDKVVEFASPNEVSEHAPPVDAEKKKREIGSNPPPAKDEFTPVTLNEAAPINVKEEELATNTVEDAPLA